MRSETGRLPAGESFVLKLSVLEAALAEAGIAIDVHLVRRAGALLYANFWPPNENIPYERLYVAAGSVPRERAKAARAHVEAEIVPSIVSWIADIVGRDARSPVRREKQEMHFSLP